MQPEDGSRRLAIRIQVRDIVMPFWEKKAANPRPSDAGRPILDLLRVWDGTRPLELPDEAARSGGEVRLASGDESLSEDLLGRIAADILGIETLDGQASDDLDFRQVGVR